MHRNVPRLSVSCVTSNLWLRLIALEERELSRCSDYAKGCMVRDSNPSRGRERKSSTPAVELTQPSLQWVPGHKFDHLRLLVPRLRMSGVIPRITSICRRDVDGENLTFTFILTPLYILEHSTVKVGHLA
jgi:hypothetical protein